MSTTKIAELELELKLTDNEVSKSITQVLNTLAKKVENASSSVSRNFKETSKKMKETAEKVTENVNEKVTEQVTKINEQVQERVSETTQTINPQVEAVKAKVSETLAEIQSKIKPAVTNISEEIRQSLSDVSNSILNSKAELQSINNLLDFDPSNTELLSQKQEVLSQSVEQARQKLQALKATKDTVYADFASGKVGKDDFREYQRQIISAEQELKRAEEELNNFEKASDKSSEEVCEDFRKVETKVNKSVSSFSNSINTARNNVERQFTKLTSSTDSLKTNLSKSFSKIGAMVTTVFSINAIKNFAQGCIEASAQVNATNSQFEQTFGSMQSQAESAIATVSKSSGILKTRLQGVGTSIYAFAKTTGMDSSSALDMMQEALQVTADSAAYYDRSLEDTAESLKSFLKGNFENDAALGLSCTETTRNTAANKLYGKSFTELSEAQKQLTLLEMVEDANKLSGAIGQASRESDGWENVIGNLKESWNQLLAVIGKPVLQVATSVIKVLTNAISNLTKWVTNAYNSLAKIFGWNAIKLSDDVNSAANSTEDLSDNANSSAEAFDNVTESAEKAKRSIAGFDKLNILTRTDKNTASSGTNSVTDKVNNISNKVSDTIKANIDDVFSDYYEKSGLKKFLESDFVKGTSSVVADAYSTISKENKKWVTENKETITKFVDGIVKSFTKFKDTVFGIFNDIGNKISEWWFNNGGKEAFTQLYDILLDIYTFFMENWNKYIQPLIDEAIDGFQNWWDESGSECFDELLTCLNSISDCISTLWNNVIKPFWYWLSEEMFPKIVPFLSMIGDWLFDIATYITGGFAASFKKLGGIADFITGVFSGDMEKAGKGLENFFKGVQEDFVSTAEFLVNIFIDAYNGIAGSLWNSYKTTANGISNLLGLGDAVTGDYEKIPKLKIELNDANKDHGGGVRHFAKGGLVKAPTLAVVGDNAGANSGNPEVIAPLSKLQGMINTSNGEDTVILGEILSYLKKLYEMFIIFRNNGGNYYQFVAQINGNDIFNEIVKQNELYKNRHNGRSAFA